MDWRSTVAFSLLYTAGYFAHAEPADSGLVAVDVDAVHGDCSVATHSKGEKVAGLRGADSAFSILERRSIHT